MKDPRNHTLPVIKFIPCNPEFPGIAPHIFDHREFLITPKLSVLKSWMLPEDFQPSDIRATLDLFYQALEGSQFSSQEKSLLSGIYLYRGLTTCILIE